MNHFETQQALDAATASLTTSLQELQFYRDLEESWEEEDKKKDALIARLEGETVSLKERVGELQAQLLLFEDKSAQNSDEETASSQLEPQELDLASKEQIVTEGILERIQDISRDFYERSLAIPADMRGCYREFSAARAVYQRQIAQLAKIFSQLVDQEISLNLTMAFARIDRDPANPPAKDLAFVKQTIELLRTTRDQVDELQTKISESLSKIEDARKALKEKSQLASSLRVDVARAKELLTLFGLNCPKEIERQFQETASRLTVVDADSDLGTRLKEMHLFRSTTPPEPPVFTSLIESLAKTEYELMQLPCNRRSSVFSGSQGRKRQLEWLFIIAANHCTKEGSDRFKGRGTLVSSIKHAGLIKEREIDDLKAASERVKSRFKVERVGRFWVWAFGARVRKDAEKYLHVCLYPDGITYAIKMGMNAHYHATRGGSQRSA